MGTDQSVPELPEHQKIPHSRFKNIKFLNDNQILRTCLSVESEDQVLAWDRLLKNMTDCDDQYLLLPKSYTYSKKAVCGSSGIVEIDFENYPFLLKEEVENRRPNHSHFTETEMWYLVYALASSAHWFRAADMKVGDIRPDNIFINECGQVRVANLCSWPSEHTNYDKTVFSQELTYLSPEEVEESKQGRTQISHDKFICESFSVGVTLLEAGLLRTSAELYDQRRKAFHYDELAKRISRWLELEMVSEEGKKERYSWALKATVAGLCEPDPRDRFTCENLWKWLSPYDAEISNLMPVKLDLPPLRSLDKYLELIGAGSHPPAHNLPREPAVSHFTPQQDFQTPQRHMMFHPPALFNPDQLQVTIHSYHPPRQSNFQPHHLKGHSSHPHSYALSSTLEGGRAPPAGERNGPRVSFGNVSTIEKRRESAEKNDEASLEFLRRINENIQLSQEKYPHSRQ